MSVLLKGCEENNVCGRTHYTRPAIGFGRPWTPMVRVLILINGGVFLAELVAGEALIAPFALDTFHPLQLWRYVSYLFLHDTGNVFHLLFNMFALWIFGSDLEEHFGSRNFLRYYFFTGIGAGVSVFLVDLESLDEREILAVCPFVGVCVSWIASLCR